MEKLDTKFQRFFTEPYGATNSSKTYLIAQMEAFLKIGNILILMIVNITNIMLTQFF